MYFLLSACLPSIEIHGFRVWGNSVHVGRESVLVSRTFSKALIKKADKSPEKSFLKWRRTAKYIMIVKNILLLQQEQSQVFFSGRESKLRLNCLPNN